MPQDPSAETYRQHIRAIAALQGITLSEQRVEALIPVVREYFDTARDLNDLPYTWSTEPAVVFQVRPLEES